MAVARELKVEMLPELTVQLQLRTSTPELGYGPANELISRGGDFTAWSVTTTSPPSVPSAPS